MLRLPKVTQQHCTPTVQVKQVDTAQLECLLPVVAYGNIMVEDISQLTFRHFRQLIQLSQCALDYLWRQCQETTRVLVSSIVAKGSSLQLRQVNSSTHLKRVCKSVKQWPFVPSKKASS